MRSQKVCLGVHIGHDRSAAIVADGRLVACVAEERLDRCKHSTSPELPMKAIHAVLDSCKITSRELNGAAISYTNVRIEHIIQQLADELSDRLDAPNLNIIGASHHWCHALSTYFTSGEKRAAVIVADGAGDIVGSKIEAESVYEGIGDSIEIISQRLQDFGMTRTDRRNAFNPAYMHPDDREKQISMGRKYEQLTYLLGFLHDQAGKTMGLASYGSPLTHFNYNIDADLDYSLTYGAILDDIYEICSHRKQPWHRFVRKNAANIAATAQTALEDIMVSLITAIHKRIPHDALCAGGGLFLNCKLNHEILKRTPFKRLYVFPAAGDDGQAVGAAFHVYRNLCGSPITERMRHAHFGPTPDVAEIQQSIEHFGLYAKKLGRDWLIERLADDITSGKLVALMRGRSEIGPRALCHRSILADPGRKGMRDYLNSVKRRELFRPFGPVTTSEAQFKYFELEQESPFMLLATTIKEEFRDQLHSIVHVDGTARVQAIEKDIDPFMHALLEAVERRTSYPVLLNTSFNLAGDPIIESAHDAITTYLASTIDTLVLEDYLISEKTCRPGL